MFPVGVTCQLSLSRIGPTVCFSSKGYTMELNKQKKKTVRPISRGELLVKLATGGQSEERLPTRCCIQGIYL